MKGKFCLVLIFSKDKVRNLLCSSFVDNHGTEQYINLPAEKYHIHEGMRYFCYLDSRTFEVIDAQVYIDDLFVVPNEKSNTIKLLNKGEEVPEFTFDPAVNGNYNHYVHALKMKFINKEFQLANRRDIDTFLEVYEKSCKLAYDHHKKKMIKANKKQFTNKLIHVIL